MFDEFLEVAKTGLDDGSRIREQLNHYAHRLSDLLEEQPYWGGVLIRDHREPRVRQASEVWAAHVNRYSRRDQLSINAALREAGLEPDVMDVDLHSSWFHSWPHTVDRRQELRKHSAASSLGPSMTYMRRFEAALAEPSRGRGPLSSHIARRVARRLRALSKG